MSTNNDNIINNDTTNEEEDESLKVDGNNVVEDNNDKSERDDNENDDDDDVVMNDNNEDNSNEEKSNNDNEQEEEDEEEDDDDYEGGEDNEDDEDNDEDDDEDDAQPKRSKRPRFVDDEADHNSDSVHNEDEVENDDDDDNENDSIVDDDDIIRTSSRRRKRRKKRRLISKAALPELDDDEYELIRENTGRVFRRNIDADVESDDGEDDVLPTSTKTKGRLKKKRITKEEEETMPDILDIPQQDNAVDDFGVIKSDEESDDGLDDFVVDDYDESTGFRDTTLNKYEELFGDLDPLREASDEEYPAMIQDTKKYDETKDPIYIKEQKIIKTDIPERLQERIDLRYKREITEEDLNAEVKWLQKIMREKVSYMYVDLDINENSDEYAFAMENQYDQESRSLLKTILRMIRIDNLEIQFIATYRRYIWQGRMSERQLQLIDELDEKWDQLSKRRFNLKTLVMSLKETEMDIDLLQLLDEAQHVYQFNDIQDYILTLPSYKLRKQRRRRKKRRDKKIANKAIVKKEEESDGEYIPKNDNDEEDRELDKKYMEETGNEKIVEDLDVKNEVELPDETEAMNTDVTAQNNICNNCKEEIEVDNIVVVNKKKYHRKCLLCHHDNHVIDDEWFLDNDLLFCAEHKPANLSSEANSNKELPGNNVLKMDSNNNNNEKINNISTDNNNNNNNNDDELEIKDDHIVVKKAIDDPKVLNSAIKDLSAAICMSPRELGLNIRFNRENHHSNDELNELSPDSAVLRAYNEYDGEFDSSLTIVEKYAHALTGTRYKTIEDVLSAVRHYSANILSRDIFVRETIRNKFRDEAVLYTEPTVKGVEDIDWKHEFVSIKRLSEKPVQEIINPDDERHKQAQFLKILKATKLHYINYWVSLKQMHDLKDEERVILKSGSTEKRDHLLESLMEEDQYIRNLLDSYTSNGQSSIAKFLTKQRHMILTEAMYLVLYPLGIKFVKEEIHRRATEYICGEASRNLQELLMEGPINDSNALETGRRVMTCVLDDDGTTQHFVFLNDFGDIEDKITLSFLNARAQADVERDRVIYRKKRKDEQKLREFVDLHKPNFIGIAATSMNAPRFKHYNIRDALKPLEYFGSIRIELVDPELSILYSRSTRSMKEFPEYSIGLRTAISIGRRILDPLSETAYAWYYAQKANTYEILSLSIFPKEISEISRYILLKKLRSTMVWSICEIGVDINSIIQRTHLVSTLQFIPGLGPIKSKHIIDRCKIKGMIYSRSTLLRESIIGECVYENCSGFIRIQSSERFLNLIPRSSEIAKISVLESTRIHPSWYDLAAEVAIDADGKRSTYTDEDLKYSLVDIPADHENIETVIRSIMRNRSRLDRVGISSRDGLSTTDKVALEDRLDIIISELQEPYKDFRQPCRPPSNKRLLQTMTGETPLTLVEGMLIPARVLDIRKNGVKVQLDSSKLNGFIYYKDFSSNIVDPIGMDPSADVDMSHWLSKRTQKNEIILVRIKSLQDIFPQFGDPPKQPHEWSVQLTCKTVDLRDKERFEKPIETDIYLVEDKEADERILNKNKERHVVKQRFISRQIDYVQFKNVNREDAERELKGSQVGDYIIRPSSKGLNHLTITMKLPRDVIVHVDVIEKGKPKNSQQLGSQLFVRGEVYEDLDHIHSAFIEPVLEHYENMCEHSKFRVFVRDEEEIEQLLISEKKSNPKGIPYLFCWSSKYPGLFVLRWLPRQRIHKEKVSVHPKGFKFYNHTYPTVDKLIIGFKKEVQKQATRRPTNYNRMPSSNNTLARPSRFDKKPAPVSVTAPYSRFDKKSAPVSVPTPYTRFDKRPDPVSTTPDLDYRNTPQPTQDRSNNLYQDSTSLYRDTSYQDRGNDSYQDRGNDSYQNRGNDSYQNRGNDSYQDRGNDSYQNRGNDSYQDRGSSYRDSSYQDRSSSYRSRSYQDRGNDSYQERDDSYRGRSYQDRGDSSYQDRSSSYRSRSYQDRGNDSYQDRGSSYQDRDNDSYQDRGSSYRDRGNDSYQDRGSSSYQDRGSSSYQDRGSSSYRDRDSSSYRDRDSSSYQDRGDSSYQDRSNTYQNTSDRYQASTPDTWHSNDVCEVYDPKEQKYVSATVTNVYGDQITVKDSYGSIFNVFSTDIRRSNRH